MSGEEQLNVAECVCSFIGDRVQVPVEREVLNLAQGLDSGRSRLRAQKCPGTG
jgi:hypothetical protein